MKKKDQILLEQAYGTVVNEYDENNPQLDSKTGGAESWKVSITRDIVESGSDFLKNIYQLGYTGEAGEADVNEIIAQLAQEVEADDRLKKALEAVVVHMVNAGRANM
jgi:hypothetical protein